MGSHKPRPTDSELSILRAMLVACAVTFTMSERVVEGVLRAVSKVGDTRLRSYDEHRALASLVKAGTRR